MGLPGKGGWHELVGWLRGWFTGGSPLHACWFASKEWVTCMPVKATPAKRCQCAEMQHTTMPPYVQGMCRACKGCMRPMAHALTQHPIQSMLAALEASQQRRVQQHQGQLQQLPQDGVLQGCQQGQGQQGFGYQEGQRRQNEEQGGHLPDQVQQDSQAQQGEEEELQQGSLGQAVGERFMPVLREPHEESQFVSHADGTGPELEKEQGAEDARAAGLKRRAGSADAEPNAATEAWDGAGAGFSSQGEGAVVQAGTDRDSGQPEVCSRKRRACSMQGEHSRPQHGSLGNVDPGGGSCMQRME